MDAVADGGEEPGGGCGDVVAGEADGGDDGGRDHQGGGEAVPVTLFVFTVDLALRT
ncbi:MAG TPA: hypothetical protein VGG42_14225 [Acidobacteriaceae bacterium]